MAEVRETGLYWIKLRTIDVTWQTAHWNNEDKTWKLLYSSDIYYDVTTVGPRILPPKDKEREPGYYWVKYYSTDLLQTAYYNGKGWLCIRLNTAYDEHKFYKIGPRITPPSE